MAARALALYRERFAETGLYENRVYDGVPMMMERLKAAGCYLWLATSKPDVYARRITAHFGLDEWLEGVFGSELDGTRADKAELLAHALIETGAESARSVMLGDRKHDIIGALRNGIQAIGALWGYGGEEELTDAGGRVLARDPGQPAEVIIARLAAPAAGN